MTIGIILGIIFFVAFAACTVYSVFALTGRRPFAKFGTGTGKKKPLAGGISAGAAALSFILFVLIPFSFHTVNAGTIAVVKHLGKAQNVRTAGTYFDFWITENYDVYDARVQILNIKANTYSKDGQSMDIMINVQYQMDTARALDIANNYGSLSALSTKIQSVTEGRAKSVLSNHSAMAIIEDRAKITNDVQEDIKAAIDKGYYAYINTVVLTNIDFTDAFEKTVEDKMIAEQEKLKAEYEKQTAIINGEKELAVAKLQAEARIASAKADAEAQVLAARAEAEATKAKSIEIARALGFTIKETAVENEDGTQSVAYDIDFTGKSAEEIKLITEYLKYVEYLSKWDGKLPEVMLGENGATVMLPLNPTA